jgi:serine/threonine-protein kinase
MSTQQILQGMRSNSLDIKTRVSRDPQDSFVPLAQFPVFEDEANRMVTRLQQQRRTDQIADAYKKIERQYDRQKWWRVLSRFRDGTLGFVGLILWVLLVFGVGGLAIWGMIQGWDHLGHWIEGLGR